MNHPARIAGSPSDQDSSLPGWVYHDADFFDSEAELVLRPAPQIICHVSDLANPGDWRTLRYLDESIVAVRGADGVVRAFANICRHRGACLVDGDAGCSRLLTCPYHGWSYRLDGSLAGLPRREDYGAVDVRRLGLIAFEVEIWRGFVFVCLSPGGMTVAEMMAPFEEQIAPYRLEDLRALGRVTIRPRGVNWKVLTDNYSDGLHIAVAHPGLTRLFGRDYGIEAGPHVDRMWGRLRETPSPAPSERAYQALLPRADHLPDDCQRLWLYFKLWPNLAFDIYPDQIDFMQFLPISAGETLIREISYAIPDQRREMRAARYLNWRINRQVNAEDTGLCERVNDGMRSPSYRPGPLGDSEVCLKSFANKLRALIPEARLKRAPPRGWSGRSTG